MELLIIEFHIPMFSSVVPLEDYPRVQNAIKMKMYRQLDAFSERNKWTMCKEVLGKEERIGCHVIISSFWSQHYNWHL